VAKQPKFYPILTREARKRVIEDDRSKNVVPCKYRKYQWYDSTNKTSKLVTRVIVSDFTANMGDSTKTVAKLANWRQLVSKGVDATNAYSREIRYLEPNSYRATSENVTHVNLAAGNDNGAALENERSVGVLIDQATASLKRKLEGNLGRAQLAAPLAESREIHRLVRQVNSLGIDMLKSAIAIKKTRGKSAAKFFGDVWLGFGFGVQPMIKDIASAANAILDYQTREDRHVRIVGTASQEYQSGLVTPAVTTICPGVKVGYHDHASHKLGIQIVAGIDLKLRSTASYGMTDQLGLGLNAVPGAIWELTPFSWVVDYGFTVGDWIDDMFYTVPGTVKYVSRSKKYQLETTGQMFAVFSPGYIGSFAAGTSVYRYVNFTREKLTTLPTRSLRIKTADEVAKHSLTKLLNLASVLAQKRGPKL